MTNHSNDLRKMTTEQLRQEYAPKAVKIDLPHSMGDLHQLVYLWAITDETIRYELVHRASTNELELLVKTVAEHFSKLEE